MSDPDFDEKKGAGLKAVKRASEKAPQGEQNPQESDGSAESGASKNTNNTQDAAGDFASAKKGA